MSGAATATLLGTAATAATATTAATAATAGLIGAGGAVTAGGVFSALSVAGALVGAAGAVGQGKASAESAKYNAAISANNAKLAQQNATLAGQEGAANTEIEQQKTRAGLGEIKAAQAASGVDVNSGSSVDVRSSAAELGELNAITVRSNAVRQAYGYQTQAAGDTAQSQLDKQQSGYDSEAGDIGAGSTLLTQSGAALNSGLWSNQLKNGALNGD